MDLVIIEGGYLVIIEGRCGDDRSPAIVVIIEGGYGDDISPAIGY